MLLTTSGTTLPYWYYFFLYDWYAFLKIKKHSLIHSHFCGAIFLNVEKKFHNLGIFRMHAFFLLLFYSYNTDFQVKSLFKPIYHLLSFHLKVSTLFAKALLWKWCFETLKEVANEKSYNQFGMNQSRIFFAQFRTCFISMSAKGFHKLRNRDEIFVIEIWK